MVGKGLKHHSSEHVGQKFALQNPHILALIPMSVHLDRDEHVFVHYYCVMHVTDQQASSRTALAKFLVDS